LAGVRDVHNAAIAAAAAGSAERHDAAGAGAGAAAAADRLREDPVAAVAARPDEAFGRGVDVHLAADTACRARSAERDHAAGAVRRAAAAADRLREDAARIGAEGFNDAIGVDLDRAAVAARVALGAERRDAAGGAARAATAADALREQGMRGIARR